MRVPLPAARMMMEMSVEVTARIVYSGSAILQPASLTFRYGHDKQGRLAQKTSEGARRNAVSALWRGECCRSEVLRALRFACARRDAAGRRSIGKRIGAGSCNSSD